MHYPSIEDIAAYYDRFAESFHASRLAGEKLFNESIEMPATFEALGSIRDGLRLLDLGCGSGIYARIFAEQGAQITAIDISQGMLKLAKSYTKGFDIDYRHVSFENFEAAESTFDLILGSFMLGYFVDLGAAFRKVRRLLKPRGIAAVSGLHPIRTSAVARTDNAYLVEDYFRQGYYYSEIVLGAEKLPIVRRTMSDIAEAAWQGGLHIERLLEPRPAIDLDDPAVDFLRRCPAVVVLRLRPRRGEDD
jgi:ubiquinone/menaquinone biosynthesis C-methylase UbiE